MNVTDDMVNAMPPARHPVVRTVPESGRKSLYLGSHVTHIVDWPREESERSSPRSTRTSRSRNSVYVHKWRVGDLLVWDNRCTLHRATKYDMFRYKRDMRRATINEYGPEVSSTAALGIPPPKVDIEKAFYGLPQLSRPRSPRRARRPKIPGPHTKDAA